jgi:hypothetical protein
VADSDIQERPSLGLPRLVAFVLLWAVVQLVMVLLRNPEVLAGAQIDTDGYLRLVRVGLLLENGGWFDGSIPRSNWPLGEQHHWTRPLDVLILLLAAPLLPFQPSHTAVAIAGSLVSPVCQLAACVALPWVVRPLVPGRERFLAMPALLVQPGVLEYGSAGRADHHALILLAFVLVLGAWMRALLNPSRRRAAFAAGAVSGLGLWVSPETLLPLAILFVSGVTAWVVHGQRYVLANLRVCAGLLAAIVLAIVLERPPSNWNAIEFDRISVAHVTMGLVALAFWCVVPRFGGRRVGPNATLEAPAGPDGARSRLSRACVGGLAALAAMAAIHPRFFLGPWADVDPEIIQIWLDHVQELRPALPSESADVGLFIARLGPGLVIAPLAVASTARKWREPEGTVWTLLLLSLLIYMPLAAMQVRFTAPVGVVFAILTVDLLDRILLRLQELRPSFRRRAARVGAMAGLLAGFAAVGLGIDAVVGQMTPRSASVAREEAGERCDLRSVSEVLADPSGPWAAPRTIAAFIDFGPELLYRTPHRVLAGPYHRNRDGILATYRLLSSENPVESRRIATERDVSLILLCPVEDRYYFERGRKIGLYHQLLEGRPPDWLRARELPPALRENFLLFEVEEY